MHRPEPLLAEFKSPFARRPAVVSARRSAGCALAAIGGLEILLDRRSRAPPLAVGAPNRLESAPICGRPQGGRGDPIAGERGDRHEAGRAGDSRHHEPVEVVEIDRASCSARGAAVTGIGSPERVQIDGSLPLVDARRRVAEPDQDQVEHEAPTAAVAVEER